MIYIKKEDQIAFDLENNRPIENDDYYAVNRWLVDTVVHLKKNGLNVINSNFDKLQLIITPVSDEAISVGDLPTDEVQSNAAGIKFVGCTWGNDMVNGINNPLDLIKIIEEYEEN